MLPNNEVEVSYKYYYDFIDRPTMVVGSNGHTMTYFYDEKNRMSSFTNIIDDVANKTGYIYGDSSLTWQSPGLIYGVSVNDVQRVNYEYDELARMKTKSIYTDNTSFNYKYSYANGAGVNATATLLQGLETPGYRYSYNYDGKGNITSVFVNGTPRLYYYYDEFNQLISEHNWDQDCTIHYEYDSGGNLTKKKYYEFSYGRPLGSLTKTVNYTYGDSNWKDKLTAFNGKAISYDAIGNMTSYDGWTFSWQAGRQLAGMSKTGYNISYGYNDSGIRTSKIVNGVKTDYYLNGANVVCETSGTDTLNYFYDENGMLVYFTLNDVPYYYVRNGQNDIVGILDNDGNEVVRYKYDTWGKLLEIGGSLANSVGRKNPYRYRGYRYDNETGLYYLQSRYYNPEMGRFINADGIIVTGNLLGNNLYTYCLNNPVNMLDPSGYHGASLDAMHRGMNTPYYAGSGYEYWEAIQALPPAGGETDDNSSVDSGEVNSNDCLVAGKLMKDIGKGVKYRIDDRGKPTEHIHVKYRNKSYDQYTNNGNKRHLGGKLPKKARKQLEDKTGYVWLMEPVPFAFRVPDFRLNPSTSDDSFYGKVIDLFNWIFGNDD